MIELGLSRIISLLKLSPLPSTWKAIHITGTNGKGSVAAYLSSLLHQSGLRVGRFTSPHLRYRWDCISINQSPVSQKLFLEIEKAVQARNLNQGIKATEFEVLTATAFEVFARQGVQVGVVECGLGGLRDATNALGQDQVLVSIVTKVGLDHVDFLGGSVEEIAWEKSGIFRKDTPVVVDGSNLDLVINVLDRRKNEVGAGQVVRASIDGLERVVTDQKRSEKVQRLPLHQKQNLSVALEAFQLAVKRFSDLKQADTSQTPTTPTSTLVTTPSDIMHNPAIDLERTISEVQTEWLGRLQWLDISSVFPGRSPSNLILLDGAHNTQSAEVLRDYIDEHLRLVSSSSSSSSSSPTATTISPPLSFQPLSSSSPHINPTSSPPSSSPSAPSKSITFLISLKSDKSPSQILPLLLRSNDNVITCPFSPVDGMPWVQPLEPLRLAELAQPFVKRKVVTTQNVRDGLRQAVEMAEGGGLVVAGSLYLVGDVLRVLDGM